MSVARIIEISATSSLSLEDAIQEGISRATETLRQVKGAWVKEQRVDVADGRVTAYQVNLLVTFVLEPSEWLVQAEPW
jgi:flavin-binding protein dodecin